MRAVLEVRRRAQRARQELRLAQPDQRGARDVRRAGAHATRRDRIAAKRGKTVEEITGLRVTMTNAAANVKVTLVKSLHGQLQAASAPSVRGLGLRQPRHQTVESQDTPAEPRHDQCRHRTCSRSRRPKERSTMRLNTMKPGRRRRKRSACASDAARRPARARPAAVACKGQRARKGGYHKVGFEGGQMPLQRRLPKVGFRSTMRRHGRSDARPSSTRSRPS